MPAVSSMDINVLNVCFDLVRSATGCSQYRAASRWTRDTSSIDSGMMEFFFAIEQAVEAADYADDLLSLR